MIQRDLVQLKRTMYLVLGYILYKLYICTVYTPYVHLKLLYFLLIKRG